jgi:ribose transport system permease protein
VNSAETRSLKRQSYNSPKPNDGALEEETIVTEDRRRSSLALLLGRRLDRPPEPMEPTEHATHRRVSRFVLPAVLVVMIGIFSGALPESFPTLANLNAILESQSVILVLAVGLLIALRSGDFDLSIAATMTFSASTVAVLTVQHGWSLGVAIVIAMAAAVVVGLINGVLIVIVGIDGFIATLGMQTLLTGLAYGITNNQVIDSVPGGLVRFANWSIGPVPGAAIYGWVLAVALWYIFDKTPAGRYLLFLGGNPEAAKLVGLRVRAIRITSFVLCAAAAGFAGLLLAGSLGSVDPSAGPEFLLPPYAAAFLGTAAIQMGRFNVLGTVIALYVLTVGVTGLELAGAPSWIGNVFNGLALIAALIAARIFSRRESAYV